MGRPQTMPEKDVVDLLVRQHEEIRHMFTALETTVPARRRELFHHLVRLLAVHETAEEEIIHPLARRTLSMGDEIVDKRLGEEREAKKMLARLDGVDPTSQRFLTELDRLRVAVLAHAAAEERDEFQRLRDELSDAQRRGLAVAVRVAEAVAPTRPHPGTESATRNLVLGPAVAMADRVRDLLRSVRG